MGRAQTGSYAAHSVDATQQMDSCRSRHGPATIPGIAPRVEPGGRACKKATSAAFRGAIPVDWIPTPTPTHQWSIRRQMTETHAGYGHKFCLFLGSENADYGESGQQSLPPPSMSGSWQHLLRNV